MAKTNWLLIVFGIIALLVISVVLVGVLALFAESPSKISGTGGDGNIALISVKGVITTEDSDDFFDGNAVSSDIVELIEEAADDSSVKGIIIEIDSPGGSGVASEEIAQAIKEANKTTVAWIREVGASGGYWVASSAEHIVANRMSVTGSIGVIGSYLEFAEFIDRYNITYQRLVSGKYKDIGTPFRELSGEEKQILQDKMDKMHGFFIDEVAKNRNLPRNKVEKAATGLFYLGSEAYELGLVDELGGKKEAIAYIEKKEGIKGDVVEFKKEKTFFDVFGSLLNENSFLVGKGIGSALVETKATQSFKITY